MSLRLEYQSILGGSFTEIDLAATRIGQFVCKFSDSHPAVLEFTAVAAQHTFPLELRRYIRFWDDAGTTPDGAPQAFDNPLFEGFIWECEPAESNLLKYVAYDPSHISGREIPVMSTAWDASIGGAIPQPDSDAVPRLIINSSIDNDVDYAFERAHGLTVGEIIQLVLDDAIHPLRWYQAAPGSDVAYQTSETAILDYIPQEKIVSTNESIRAFLDRITQQHYPEYAFRWEPGSHYWRWYSRLSTSPITLTLNDPVPANGLPVLSMELHRSLEGRFPAVTIYGPETAGPVEVFSTLDGTLVPIDPPVTLETYTDTHGIGTVQVHSQYQIVDPEKRRGAKLLPQFTVVRESDYHSVITRSPTFEISFDTGSTWQAIESCIFDFQQGIVHFGEGLYTYIWMDHPPAGTTQHFYPPNAFRLIWAPYSAPLIVRSPTSGYAGTSYTVTGQTSELHVYDEMLAVGYNRVGLPVTTVSRLAQYQKLADAIHSARKDIVYTGGCILDGLHYDFCRLQRAINLAAVDENGDSLTTGWEDIYAVVSDVEFNFAEQTTSLVFSQEALNLWGDNIDLLKQRLRISGPMERVRIFNYYYTWRHQESTYANKPGGYHVWSGLVYNDYDLYWDRLNGSFELGIRPGEGIS